jgi:hypothetical protein
MRTSIEMLSLDAHPSRTRQEQLLEDSASTVTIGTTRMNDIKDIDENHYHQDRNIETRKKGTNDTTMTDNEQPTQEINNKKQQ